MVHDGSYARKREAIDERELRIGNATISEETAFRIIEVVEKEYSTYNGIHLTDQQIRDLAKAAIELYDSEYTRTDNGFGGLKRGKNVRESVKLAARQIYGERYEDDLSPSKEQSDYMRKN